MLPVTPTGFLAVVTPMPPFSAVMVAVAARLFHRRNMAMARALELTFKKYAGIPIKDDQANGIIESIQKRYFDDRKTRGRQALDRGLAAIINRRRADLDRAGVTDEERSQLIDVMRRFLRVPVPAQISGNRVGGRGNTDSCPCRVSRSLDRGGRALLPENGRTKFKAREI